MAPEAEVPLLDMGTPDLCDCCRQYQTLVREQSDNIAEAAIERADGDMGYAFALIHQMSVEVAAGNAEVEKDLVEAASATYHLKREQYEETGREASE